jgi:hypothetical protein
MSLSAPGLLGMRPPLLQMRQIPGVGPYTAAAVASIAFDDPAAAVDGNVIRVISRLRALRGNPTKMGKTWDRLAAELLHTERPGCHNQVCIVDTHIWSGRDICCGDQRWVVPTTYEHMGHAASGCSSAAQSKLLAATASCSVRSECGILAQATRRQPPNKRCQHSAASVTGAAAPAAAAAAAVRP